MNDQHETTTDLLKAARSLRWRHTTSPLANAVRRWQRAGCPGLEAQEGDNWNHAGGVALEVLDQLEARMSGPLPSASEQLARLILEVAQDAEEAMPDHVVADALLQAAAIFVLERGSMTERQSQLQPRVAVNVLKAHLVRLGARMIGGRQ